MPFPTVNNDMLNLGSMAGNIPVIDPGGKLSTSLLDVGNSANKILQLNSSGQLPALNGSQLTNLPVSGGGWNLLSTQQGVAVTQIDFTSLITNAYKNYALVLDNIQKNDSSSINFRMSTDNGATFDSGSTHYQFATIGINSVGSEVNSNSGSGAASVQLAPLNINGSDGHMSMVMFLYDPMNTSIEANFTWQLFGSSGSLHSFNGAGKRAQAGAHNAIRIFAAGGSFVQGTFKLYGIN